MYLFQGGNVSKLRDITGELAAVSLDHEMTPKKLKAMVEEAKMKEESSSGKFIFRVRAPIPPLEQEALTLCL
jgi:hypothetical protein